jgi:hypothetical protein
MSYLGTKISIDLFFACSIAIVWYYGLMINTAYQTLHAEQTPQISLFEPTNTQIAERIGQILSAYEKRLQETMRRDELINVKQFPRYMNRKELISYLGHEKIFNILVEEYGLRPFRQEHKCSIYCTKDVEQKCIQFERNIYA